MVSGSDLTRSMSSRDRAFKAGRLRSIHAASSSSPESPGEEGSWSRLSKLIENAHQRVKDTPAGFRRGVSVLGEHLTGHGHGLGHSVARQIGCRNVVEAIAVDVRSSDVEDTVTVQVEGVEREHVIEARLLRVARLEEEAGKAVSPFQGTPAPAQ